VSKRPIDESEQYIYIECGVTPIMWTHNSGSIFPTEVCHVKEKTNV
jgi:hypothetical protein